MVDGVASACLHLTSETSFPILCTVHVTPHTSDPHHQYAGTAFEDEDLQSATSKVLDEDRTVSVKREGAGQLPSYLITGLYKLNLL